MNKFIEIAGRIGAQRHLVAIRDGFVAIMPLMILGSFATLLNNLPINAYQNFMENLFGSDAWKGFGGSLWNGTFAIVSLLIVFTVSYQLARSYNKDGLSSGVVALAALITITQETGDWGIPFAWVGAQGLFISIFVALISTEVFTRLLGNERLNIKMPEGVPPAVSRSFSALFPAMITLSIFGLIKVLTVVGGMPDIHEAFFNALQAPVSKMANTLWSAIFVAVIIHVLWFFGLHGSNILEPLMQAVYLPAIEANAAALAAGQEIPNIVTKPFFDAFMNLGGTGATLGLIIAVFIVGRKHKQYRTVSGLGAAPGLFNINEPVLFGFPMVLNPVLLVPFILTPVILTVFSYLVTAAGIVPKTIAFIPWTTPPIIGGFLATGSWKGAVLATVNLVIAVLMYIPFIKYAERAEIKKVEEELAAKKAAEETSAQQVESLSEEEKTLITSGK